MKRMTITNSKVRRGNRQFTRAWISLTALLFAISFAPTAWAQKTIVSGQTFISPDAAAEALIAAAETFNVNELERILGPGAKDILHSDEPVTDREVAVEFAKLARQKKALTPDKKNPRLVLMSIGDDDWPFPLPLVKRGAKWSFDAAAGRQEVLFRRIGRNELDAIEICRGYVEAQHEYAAQKRDGAPVNQYAQRIISTPGKQDGLAWRNADGTPGGPVGDEIGKAIEKGYTDKTAPYHGYFFKVLKGQGPAAPLGQLDFIVKGYMIGGFALIAYPAKHRVTGVKTFMVSQDGALYEKDLGPNTSEIVKTIERFNPDATWSVVIEDN